MRLKMQNTEAAEAENTEVAEAENMKSSLIQDEEHEITKSMSGVIKKEDVKDDEKAGCSCKLEERKGQSKHCDSFL
jgi:hypothetical protein